MFSVRVWRSTSRSRELFLPARDPRDWVGGLRDRGGYLGKCGRPGLSPPLQWTRRIQSIKHGFACESIRNSWCPHMYSEPEAIHMLEV